MLSKLITVIVSVLVLLGASLAVLTTQADAARAVSISVSKTTAIPGQWLVIRGKLPSRGVKRLELERTLYKVTAMRGKSKADGSYRFRIRMMSMPDEGFRVHVVGGPVSRTVHVKSVRQDITLTGRGGDLTAQVTPAMERPITLQRKTSATGWENVTTKSTGKNGSVGFQVPIGATYRAVAQQVRDILPYYSVAYVTAYPPLTESPSSLAGPRKVYHPQPDSGNSAAAKHSWWPAAKTWDWEYATGMGEWTNYAEGTGRNSLTYGGMYQHTGSPRPDQPSYGSTSTTYRKAGSATGNWEMKSKFLQKAPGYTPYTVRYSLVPAGTPDGTRPRTEIVVAEHTGYTDKTRIGVRDGQNEYSKTLSGWAHNDKNWHAYGLQLTGKRVTWLVNGKVVSSLKRPAALQGALVPRIELVATPGARMTYSTMNTDWIRYFKLKSDANLSGSTSGFTTTPLAAAPKAAPQRTAGAAKSGKPAGLTGARVSSRYALRCGA